MRPACCAARQPPTVAQLRCSLFTLPPRANLRAPRFQLLDPVTTEPPVPTNGGRPMSATGLSTMLATLEAVQHGAGDIEATVSQADSWGTLTLPCQRAGSAARSLHLAQPHPAQLVECQQCRHVVLACSTLQHHQQQCCQRPAVQGVPSASQPEGLSSSSEQDVPPERSSGSKRKRASGVQGGATSACAAANYDDSPVLPSGNLAGAVVFG